MMVCWLNPLITYSDMNRQLLFQKLMLRNCMLKHQKIDEIPALVYHFDESTRVIPREYINKIMNNRNIKFDADSIDFADQSEELAPLLGKILTSVQGHSAAGPFLGPIEDAEAVNCQKVVKYPMHLQQMAERVKEEYYCNLFMFHCDMRRIFYNCRIYYREETDAYQAANVLEQFYVSELKKANLIQSIM